MLAAPVIPADESLSRKEACRQGHNAWEVGLVALYESDQLEFAGMLLIL